MWDYSKFLQALRLLEPDAAVPAFSGFHPASFGSTYYAYMKMDENSMMQELREKESFTNNRIEEPASTGIYYFKSYKLFEKFASQYIKDPIQKLNEFYVSLVLNYMLEENLKVYVPFVDKFICLGTPEDYAEYSFWENKKNLNYAELKNEVSLKFDKFKDISKDSLDQNHRYWDELENAIRK